MTPLYINLIGHKCFWTNIALQYMITCTPISSIVRIQVLLGYVDHQNDLLTIVQHAIITQLFKHETLFS